MRGTKQKSFVASSKTLQQEWFVVDAKDKVLGRLATKVAMVLMGKHKPIYTPFLDTGDFVIV
jgi:large subunit ribosomal protein L13